MYQARYRGRDTSDESYHIILVPPFYAKHAPFREIPPCKGVTLTIALTGLFFSFFSNFFLS